MSRVRKSRDVVSELIGYDPISGTFFRKKTLSPNTRDGDPTFIDKQGYAWIYVGGSKHKAHHLAWLLTYGVWPQMDIDHINGERSDNRISNLRLATNQQNCANAKVSVLNTSGHKAVRKRNGKWQVRIGAGGRIHVGAFETLEEAILERDKALSSEYGEFVRSETLTAIKEALS